MFCQFIQRSLQYIDKKTWLDSLENTQEDTRIRFITCFIWFHMSHSGLGVVCACFDRKAKKENIVHILAWNATHIELSHKNRSQCSTILWCVWRCLRFSAILIIIFRYVHLPLLFAVAYHHSMAICMRVYLNKIMPLLFVRHAKCLVWRCEQMYTGLRIHWLFISVENMLSLQIFGSQPIRHHRNTNIIPRQRIRAFFLYLSRYLHAHVNACERVCAVHCACVWVPMPICD